MAVRAPFDEVKFLAPVRAAMRGWSTADHAGLWDRINATDAVIRDMERRGRFIVGNSVHQKAQRELDALWNRYSDLYSERLKSQMAVSRAPKLEPGQSYVTRHSDGDVVGYTVLSIEGGLVRVEFENGARNAFSLTSPLHITSLPLAA